MGFFSVLKNKAYLSCYRNNSKVLFSVLPSKAIDKESDGEGAKDATNREDGDSDGPDGCEGVLGDGLLVAVKPGFIDETLNDLRGRRVVERFYENKQ